MADTKISDDPAISSISGSELIPVVSGGANKVATPAQIKTYANVGGLEALLNVANTTGTHKIVVSDATASKVLVLNSSKEIVSHSLNSGYLDFLNSLSGNVQSQIDALQSTISTLENGHSWKEPCKVASVHNETIIGFGAFGSIDGVTLVNLDRVLLFNQTNPEENGIYYKMGPDLIRADDANTSDKIASACVVILEGTVNHDKMFLCTNDKIFAFNSDPIVFVERGGTSYTGTSNRITISGGVINISTAYVGQSSINTVGTITAGTWNGAVIPAAYIEITPTPGTGTAVQFDKDRDYGTEASPETGNITLNSSGAVAGVVSMVIHNNSTAPTFSGVFKEMTGSSGYVTGVNNYIYCMYRNSSKVLYSISQEA
jgi:hypothetical protein